MTLAWIYLSAGYYASTLFTADFLSPYSANFVHKTVKYAVAVLLSLWMARQLVYYRLGFLSGGLAVLGVVAVLVNSSISTTAVTLLGGASFAGFLLLIATLDQHTQKLTRAVIWSGALVGVGALMEMALFQETMVLYSEYAGRPRSISTLLNPNNLGVYQGACLVLWAHTFARGRITLAPGALIAFALVASGSRTALVALLLAGVVAVIWDRSLVTTIQHRWRPCLAAMVAVAFSGVLGGVAVVAAVSNAHQQRSEQTQPQSHAAALGVRIESPADQPAPTGIVQPIPAPPAPASSLLDLTTLKLRLEFLAQYLSLLDASLLFPDFHEKRSRVIHDNAYLSLLNSHGALLLVLLCWAWRRRPTFSTSIPADDLRAYRHVTIFYLISGLSNSFINSFPNSQLFFIAAGVWLVSSKAQPPGSTPARI